MPIADSRVEVRIPRWPQSQIKYFWKAQTSQTSLSYNPHPYIPQQSQTILRLPKVLITSHVFLVLRKNLWLFIAWSIWDLGKCEVKREFIGKSIINKPDVLTRLEKPIYLTNGIPGTCVKYCHILNWQDSDNKCPQYLTSLERNEVRICKYLVPGVRYYM